MKIVFAGTPEFAVPSLCALHTAGFDIAAVLTQPDKPQGRKGILTPSAVKQAALGAGISVLQPNKLKDDFSALKELRADLMVTCAYGQILTQNILDLFPLGVWNVHASLLPAYRGAEESWREAWDKFDYKINIDCIFEQFDYAIQVPYNSASPRWKSQVSDVLAQIYAGNQEVSSGLDKIAEIVNTETAKKLADN